MITCMRSVRLKATQVSGIDAELFPVFNFSFRSVQNHKVGLEVFEFFLAGTDEHVGLEVSLPCHFHDEAHCQTGVGVGAAESVDDIKGLVAQLLVGDSLQSVPCSGCDSLVVVLIFVGSPPRWCRGSRRPSQRTCPWANGRCKCRSSRSQRRVQSSDPSRSLRVRGLFRRCKSSSQEDCG